MTAGKTIPAFFCLALALSACGSSGGAQQPPPPPVVAPPEPAGPDPLNFPDEPGLTGAQETERSSLAETPEFMGQWSLSEVGADYAYARGYTGEGVTVGIIDTGVDSGHEALSGKLHSRSGVASRSCPGGNCSFSPIRDTASHGTAVGGVIAAAKLGNRMHGVAYDAELLAIGIQLGSGTPVYRPVNLSNAASYRSLDEQGQGVYRRLSGATRIVNHSFGYEGVVTDYTASGYRAAFGRTVNSLLQAGTPDSDKIILVWAAGNSFGKRDANGVLADASSPNITAGTPHLFPALKEHFITVVATQSDGRIAPYSNRCGVAADFCIAAPGSAISGPFARSTDSYAAWNGTSLAAPQVAGALALMEEAFRAQLGSTEMVTRLLAAADKSGIYANRDVYGQGLLDVEKATRPIGSMQAALSTSLDGPSLALTGSRIAPGPAWGDALHSSLAGLELAVFDSLKAPFFIPMRALTAEWPLDARLRLDRNFDEFVNRAFPGSLDSGAVSGDWALGSALALGSGSLNGSPLEWSTPVANAFIALGAHGLGLSREVLRFGRNSRLRAGFFLQQSGAARGELLAAPGRASGALLSIDLAGKGRRLSAEAGHLQEAERLLGAGAAGAYGGLAGNTWFTRVQVQQDLGRRWSVMAVAQGGHTRGQTISGLFRGKQTVVSSAFSASLHWARTRSTGSHRFWLSLSQPLRNESGGLELDYPAGRTRAGQVLRKTAFLSAVPSGRQVDLTLGYAAMLPGATSDSAGWRIRLEASRSFRPGHVAWAAPENSVFVALSRSILSR